MSGPEDNPDDDDFDYADEDIPFDPYGDFEDGLCACC